ncbi:MAG: heme exporter protein CcmB [Geminicoccaceae bacterium]|nr:heme exporter protein CcmB [Geminicoccaceae bacterium]MCS7266665.1 heme exporter protein CcmB [Geminicoccaceae bacterium]MCX7630113.1 heme exporter protein CcmB [Geminicoccaceae bacterium]MDW8123298.1 heme exporter protein CcmB [Geminicoccaceae bacterium]MDW8340401.1 heme exporter protein CcmB [Geminicoccaceae bacterium]
MLKAVFALLARDLRLARRRAGESLLVVAFFVLALTLFPLGVGASPDILARIGTGVIWVLALLAVLLGLERLFQPDLEDGSLEQLLLSVAPLELLVAVRCLAHWLGTGLLLALSSPLLAILAHLPSEALWALPLSLLLGTPTLTLVGAIGAALLAGSGRGAMLAALLVLPLEIPVLIFGLAAAEALIAGTDARAALLFLGAFFLGALALAPFAVAAALRLALE